MVRYFTLVIVFLSLGSISNAQTILFEEDFTDGIPEDWTILNEDGLTPAEEVDAFTDGWIGHIAGTDTAAASTSYYDPSGQANDYLITPAVSIGNFSKIVWSARSVDASYPDGYQVLISTTGTDTASFTDTLLTVTEESAYFSTRSIELDAEGYANQDIYIAFQNNTNNGYILLIDDVVFLGAETAGVEYPAVYESTLTLYPNPTVDQLTAKTNEQVISFIVYSMTGEVLTKSNSNQIDVSDLEAGTYIAQIQTSTGVRTEQFIKK